MVEQFQSRPHPRLEKGMRAHCSRTNASHAHAHTHTRMSCFLRCFTCDENLFADFAEPPMLFSARLKLDPSLLPGQSSTRRAVSETQQGRPMEVKAWPLETDGDIIYIMCRQADTRLTNEVPFIFAGVELDMTVTPHHPY